MISDNPINFGARFAYMTALEVHWPEVLKSLRDDVFPAYRTCWESNPNSPVLQNLSLLSEAQNVGPDVGPGDVRKVDRAVRRWGKAHGFIDAWILDLAVQSMYSWVYKRKISTWAYFPKDLNTPKFEPEIGSVWIPEHQTWPEFKRCAAEIYRREQAKYRAEIRKLWGEGQPKLSQTAGWTVLWQRGKSPEAIQIHHLRTAGKSVSLANIHQSVHAFAGSAGLTLRAAKAGGWACSFGSPDESARPTGQLTGVQAMLNRVRAVAGIKPH